MSNFHVGQRVICVGRLIYGAAPVTITPNCGTTYTVRYGRFAENMPTILLAEIRNPPVRTTYGFVEQGFESAAFRAVIEFKTDISIFTDMLAPNRRALEPRLTEQV